MARPRSDPVSRFWTFVQKTDECWLWRGAPDKDGYGRFNLDGKTHKAHRVSYSWFVGPIPAGLQLDHLCRVRNCVNPGHLEPVTNALNQYRGDSVMGRNHRKRRCKYGHPFTDENTYTRPNGYRNCRICQRRVQKISRGEGVE